MNNECLSPPVWLKNLLEDRMGKKTIKWLIPDCGLSAAHRFTVCFDDDTRLFVKAATDSETAQWLRTEHLTLTSIKQSFAPSVIQWFEYPEELPVLITQDLSHAYWPASHQGVNWRNGDIDMLLESVTKLASVEASTALPALQNPTTSLWSGIAERLEPFLSFGLCSRQWFTTAIDVLIAAEKDIDLTGSTLIHGDIRSDNVCLLDNRAVMVDWSDAASGNTNYNLAMLLPTLYLEGGPKPYQMMPDGGGWAALQAARHIKRLSVDFEMPHWLKKVFLKIIAIELDWAVDCLELPRPNGVTALI